MQQTHCLFRPGVDKLFSTRAAVMNLSFKGPHSMLPRLFQLSRSRNENMLKSFENRIHLQYGNALHDYNAFIGYQAIRKRE